MKSSLVNKEGEAEGNGEEEESKREEGEVHGFDRELTLISFPASFFASFPAFFPISFLVSFPVGV